MTEDHPEAPSQINTHLMVDAISQGGELRLIVVKHFTGWKEDEDGS